MQKKILLSIFTFLLGLVFIFSGYIKLFPIEPFEMNFVELGIFNWTFAPFVARLLIALEIILGILLITQQSVKLTLKGIVVLLIFFTFYLIFAIIKDGNSGNCGCFGTYLQMTPAESIVKNIFMIVAAMIVYKLQDNDLQINRHLLAISLLIALALPIIFYFSWIQVVANPFNFIVFEIILLFIISVLLLNLRFKKLIIKKVSIFAIIISSVALPFIINPPDLFVIETYDIGKLNYELKADKLDAFRTNKIDNNWKKGRKVIAFLSLTCPHCRDMAFKLHIIKKQHPEMKILFVYGGENKDKKLFLARAKCSDMPSIDLSMDEMVKITGPFFPTVVGIENSKVLNKWSVVNMSEDEMTSFFENKK